MRQLAVLVAVFMFLMNGPILGQRTPLPRQSRSLIEYSSAMEALARSASPSVVQVLVQTVSPLGAAGTQRAGFVSEQEATGSGVIIDPTGFVVTNAHVVKNARRIEVKILKTEEKEPEPHAHVIPAKLIGIDEEVDLAVLKIEGANLPTLSFLDSDTLRQGQVVLALGSPLGLQNSLTHGIVSATFRQLNPESPMVYIQTDAPINPGNSGGPLLDVEGRIVGINTMIFSESGGNEGIGFAIPSNTVQEVAQKLRRDGRVRRGAIGVTPQPITSKLAAALGLDRDTGVILSDVAPHGAAEAAGLEPGDIVLSIDGKPIREVRQLILEVFRRSPGDRLNIEVLHGKERKTLPVAVIERRNPPVQLEDLADYDTALVRELGILALTVDEKVNAVLPDLRKLSGVAVAAVPAEFAGLNPGLLTGDVIYSLNNQRIDSIEDLRAFMKEKKSGDPLALHLERNGQLIYLTLVLE